MRVSRIVLLLVALIAGGLAAFLATRGGNEPQQAPVTQVVQEARAQVLIAKSNVGVGERLTADNVQWQDWPEGAVRPEYITSAGTPNAIDQMKGAIARFELFSGEPIQQNKLVRSDQGYLSAVLDKGMRGVSISVAAESASGGFIVPNDHVDVILTQSGPSGQTSSTLLSNVRVLAINTRLGETGKTGGTEDDGSDPNASPKSQVFPGTAIATVELDPVQAETIINASQLGRLSLALRSIVDFKPTPGEQDAIKRNAPIKLIRYGQEASVMAGAATGGADATQAGLPVPTTTVSVGPGVAVD
jgi:pilus assembly protein CpaB